MRLNIFLGGAEIPTKLLLFFFSGKKKEPKPKLFGPDIFGWGVFHVKGWGPKVRSKPREIKRFGGISRDFGWDIPVVPEKFEEKKSVFNFGP